MILIAFIFLQLIVVQIVDVILPVTTTFVWLVVSLIEVVMDDFCIAAIDDAIVFPSADASYAL
jgi:hypothetical protein